MAFTIKQLDHVVVCVTDMERALQFYCGVLGCVEERRIPSINLVQLRAGSSLIDVLLADAMPEAGRRNMDHFALRIDPFDEASLRAHFAAHGVEVGEVAVRYGAEGNGPSMYLSDPDGNTVELKGSPTND
jgi:glyoxylase I family protein